MRTEALRVIKKMPLTEDAFCFYNDKNDKIKLRFFKCIFSPSRYNNKPVLRADTDIFCCSFFKNAFNLVCVDDVTVKTKKVISSSFIITIIKPISIY